MTLWLLFAALTLVVLVWLVRPLLRTPAKGIPEKSVGEKTAGRIAAIVIVVMLPLGAGALYAALGHPTLPGQPFAERMKNPVFVAQTQALDLAQTLARAPRAAGYAELGERLGQLADGAVTPQAGEAFAQALELDPAEPRARYYTGLALAQRGQVTKALMVWRALETDSKPDAPWLTQLRRNIAEAETAASRIPPGD
jgi:cytochrome c-type biogenesis protein CcmH